MGALALWSILGTLGYEIVTGKESMFEIAGVPDKVTETLSQRKHRGDHRLAVAAVDTSLMNDLSILIFSKEKIVR